MNWKVLASLFAGLYTILLITSAILLNSNYFLIILGTSFSVIATLLGLGTTLLGIKKEKYLNEKITQLEKIYRAKISTPQRITSRHLRDSETGLGGEAFFDLALQTRIATAKRQLWPTTVMLLEVQPRNEIKKVDPNSLITSFALLVAKNFRESDLVCRIGELSFGISLDNTSKEGGVWAIEKLQETMLKHDFKGSIAVGIATYPTHGFNSEQLITQARLALIKAYSIPTNPEMTSIEIASEDN